MVHHVYPGYWQFILLYYCFYWLHGIYWWMWGHYHTIYHQFMLFITGLWGLSDSSVTVDKVLFECSSDTDHLLSLYSRRVSSYSSKWILIVIPLVYWKNPYRVSRESRPPNIQSLNPFITSAKKECDPTGAFWSNVLQYKIYMHFGRKQLSIRLNQPKKLWIISFF